MKFYLIIIPIPNAQIKIMIGKRDELNEFLKKEYLSEMDKSNTARSLWFKDQNRFFFLLRNDIKLSHGIIAHEAKHLTNFIMEARSYKLSFKNDEPECYLLNYIVDKIYLIIKKDKTIKI